ncbi:MAG: NAD(P)H-hydrate dehydratase, partial [Gammaproteobacteria bacterium]|nr:NAD(P)H-hydrate dehydratase [Gammaproteobacteria bacterium]
GRSAWGRQLWQRVQALTVPLIVDADALNLLAETLGDTADAKVQERPWILTPHPGEAARLLDSDVQTIEQDRLAAARELTRRTGAVVVLKGAGSVIAHAGGVAIATGGNPGMASGGMGDVLAGICGALVAQGVPVAQAAGVAVCWHAAAADRVARQQGYCALLASDVSAVLGELALGWDGSVQETSGD